MKLVLISLIIFVGIVNNNQELFYKDHLLSQFSCKFTSSKGNNYDFYSNEPYEIILNGVSRKIVFCLNYTEKSEHLARELAPNGLVNTEAFTQAIIEEVLIEDQEIHFFRVFVPIPEENKKKENLYETIFEINCGENSVKAYSLNTQLNILQINLSSPNFCVKTIIENNSLFTKTLNPALGLTLLFGGILMISLERTNPLTAFSIFGASLFISQGLFFKISTWNYERPESIEQDDLIILLLLGLFGAAIGLVIGLTCKYFGKNLALFYSFYMVVFLFTLPISQIIPLIAPDYMRLFSIIIGILTLVITYFVSKKLMPLYREFIIITLNLLGCVFILLGIRFFTGQHILSPLSSEADFFERTSTEPICILSILTNSFTIFALIYDITHVEYEDGKK